MQSCKPLSKKPYLRQKVPYKREAGKGYKLLCCVSHLPLPRLIASILPRDKWALCKTCLGPPKKGWGTCAVWHHSHVQPPHTGYAQRVAATAGAVHSSPAPAAAGAAGRGGAVVGWGSS
eukprot:1152002-Pelagomonas_calceolata.AAC.3